MLYAQSLAIQMGVCRRGGCYPESPCPSLRTTATISLPEGHVYTGGTEAGVMYSVIAQHQRWVLLIPPEEKDAVTLKDTCIGVNYTCVILLSTWQ